MIVENCKFSELQPGDLIRLKTFSLGVQVWYEDFIFLGFQEKGPHCRTGAYEFQFASLAVISVYSSVTGGVKNVELFEDNKIELLQKCIETDNEVK